MCEEGYKLENGTIKDTTAIIYCDGDENQTYAEWGAPRPNCERKFHVQSMYLVCYSYISKVYKFIV